MSETNNNKKNPYSLSLDNLKTGGKGRNGIYPVTFPELPDTDGNPGILHYKPLSMSRARELTNQAKEAEASGNFDQVEQIITEVSERIVKENGDPYAEREQWADVPLNILNLIFTRLMDQTRLVSEGNALAGIELRE